MAGTVAADSRSVADRRCRPSRCGGKHGSSVLCSTDAPHEGAAIPAPISPLLYSSPHPAPLPPFPPPPFRDDYASILTHPAERISCCQVLRDFEELPAAAVRSLRDSLIGLLLQHGTHSGPVRMQLCLAVSALAAHLPAAQWSSAGVVPWLWERLSAQPNQQGLPCMLELLVVLPQEAGSYRPAVRPERRRQVYDELTANFSEAITILTFCVSGTGASSTRPAECWGIATCLKPMTHGH